MLDLKKNLLDRQSDAKVNPDLAQYYLNFNTYKSQRALRPGHVTELAEKMRTNLFRTGNIAFAKLNGNTYMVDGQHVCHAIIEANATETCTVEKFQAADKMELSQIYRQFEILPRSLGDMIKAEAGALELTWPDHISRLIVGVAAMEKASQARLGYASRPSNKYSKKAMTRDDQVALLKHYLKEGVFVAELLTFNGENLTGKGAQHLKRKGVAFIIVKSWRINKNDAGVFWVRVRDGERLTKEMPEKRLYDFLKASKSHYASSAYKGVRKITDHEFACRCAVAWNAFRKNKSTNLAYHSGKDVPKLI